MRKPEIDTNTMQGSDKYCLYSFFSSSACQRIVIAAHLKSIPLTFSYLDLRDAPLAEQLKSSGQRLPANVPALVVTHYDGSTTLIRDAVQILEYFEERFPDANPLLPPTNQIKRRELTRDFMDIITIDVEPPTSSRLAKAIRGALEDQESFATGVFDEGFAKYESLLKSSRGKEAEACLYTVGDDVTLADICLVPTVERAITYRMDLTMAPHVRRIYNHLKQLPAFSNADWRKHANSHRRL